MKYGSILEDPMRSSTWMVLAATLAVVPYAANAQTTAPTPALVSERTLSLNAAHEAATTALEQCRKDGYKVTVTVLNRQTPAGSTGHSVHGTEVRP